MDFMKNQNNENLQNKSQEKEPNTATAVLYHIQKTYKGTVSILLVVIAVLAVSLYNATRRDTE